MIIQATDAHGAYVPRFCYHEKLSIAANCRMCLVEVEKAPKPLPACATPVAEGMKVFTQVAQGHRGPEGDDGVPAHQPPARLPDLRPGRRVRAAGPRDGLRPRRRALRRAQARGQGPEPRTAGLHRHDALHPLHALRALRPGNRRHPGARHHSAAATACRSRPTSRRASTTSCRATSSTCARSARSTTRRSATARAPGK